ncbi:hypothetical protein VFPBJ_09075 [Purpureocillium lilacinum]|uniref:Uncharacterized protein n=1 Tax=Purpureocillium lilacinum TaxID=33203 RepID=A0A179GC67_PURLI|nr:hypothetical protein VFPBJ_09075 [Purpureocillium lilacinum]
MVWASRSVSAVVVRSVHDIHNRWCNSKPWCHHQSSARCGVRLTTRLSTRLGRSPARLLMRTATAAVPRCCAYYRCKRRRHPPRHRVVNQWAANTTSRVRTYSRRDDKGADLVKSFPALFSISRLVSKRFMSSAEAT